MNEWWPHTARLERIGAGFGGTHRPATFPSLLPVLALDRIWVRPARALTSLSVVRGWRERLASDHLPLVADIRIDRDARPGR